MGYKHGIPDKFVVLALVIPGSLRQSEGHSMDSRGFVLVLLLFVSAVRSTKKSRCHIADEY